MSNNINLYWFKATNCKEIAPRS